MYLYTNIINSFIYSVAAELKVIAHVDCVSYHGALCLFKIY